MLVVKVGSVGNVDGAVKRLARRLIGEVQHPTVGWQAELYRYAKYPGSTCWRRVQQLWRLHKPDAALHR
jgi:hypothetical protein